MNKQLITEFQKNYEQENTPCLPEYLKQYHFISCLRDEPQRKIWILQNKNGKRILCKYAQGDERTMLRAEKNMDDRITVNGKISFFPYLIDFYETETDSYLLREYIHGDTLEELVEKNGPFSPADARSIIQMLGRCLSRLHHAQPPIIYRDLKPSNIVLTKAGECYLIDTGTVRIYQEGNEQDTIFMGTAATAAPEQYGARQTDGRTDLYALGILYTYLLTGELKQPTGPEVLPHGPETAIIKKATAFDPDNRYQTVEEFLAALDRRLTHKKYYISAIVALSMAFICCLCLLIGHLPSPAENGSLSEKETGSVIPAASGETPTKETTKPETEPLPPKEVTFDSKLLRHAVALALDKSDDETIYYSELGRITHLLICGQHAFSEYGQHNQTPVHHMINGDINTINHYLSPTYGDIHDLSLLAHMTNLKTLVLDYQNISDLTPLAELSLNYVSLCGNPVTDLSPLNCRYLKTLIIDDTKVSSLAPCNTSPHLEELSITRTMITDLTPVLNSPIHKLNIGELLLNDYGQLQRLPINALVCKQLPHTAFEELSQVAGLSSLTLLESDIVSMQEITMFHRVSDLNINNNQLSDLHGIGSFSNLSALYADINSVQTLAGLEESRTLKKLCLSANKIEDFTALRGLTSLTELTISKETSDKLYEAVPEPWFQVITVD